MLPTRFRLPLVFLAAAVVALLGGGLMRDAVERTLIYFPTRLSAAVRPSALKHAEITEIDLVAEDGVRLSAWHLRARESRGVTLLFFHGNGGNLADRVPHAHRLAERGLDVLLLDYRGYGKSEGTPSEDGIYRDGEAARAWLRSAGVPPERTVFLGESLGSAVALELASRRAPAGVILLAPFTSVRELGRVAYPFVPDGVYGWLRHRFDNAAKIARVEAPVLVVHGERDEIVPFSMGRRLSELAGERGALHAVPRAGHNDLPETGGSAYLDRVASFALRCVVEPR